MLVLVILLPIYQVVRYTAASLAASEPRPHLPDVPPDRGQGRGLAHVSRQGVSCSSAHSGLLTPYCAQVQHRAPPPVYPGPRGHGRQGVSRLRRGGAVQRGDELLWDLVQKYGGVSFQLLSTLRMHRLYRTYSVHVMSCTFNICSLILHYIIL